MKKKGKKYCHFQIFLLDFSIRIFCCSGFFILCNYSSHWVLIPCCRCFIDSSISFIYKLPLMNYRLNSYVGTEKVNFNKNNNDVMKQNRIHKSWRVTYEAEFKLILVSISSNTKQIFSRFSSESLQIQSG